MSNALVIDASACVDLLLGEPLGARVANRLGDHNLHAPAHIDLELLSAFGRIERSGLLTPAQVDARLHEAQDIPIRRHALSDLAVGAWRRRADLRISDAFYVELAVQLDVPLITTDFRLARVSAQAETV